jgi:hypothetical protein
MDSHEGAARIAKEYSREVEILDEVVEVRVESALWVSVAFA